VLVAPVRSFLKLGRMNPRIRTAVVALLCSAVFSGVSSGQQQQPPPPPPEASQFDFWIGEWDVTTPDGKPAGQSLIQSINRGRALLENWSSGGGKFQGKSLNAYDATTKKWKQFWVDTSGNVLELSGGIVDGSMVLSGKSVSADGGEVLERITWTPSADGSVRQHWEQSTDGGTTWSTAFDGHYAKKAAKTE